MDCEVTQDNLTDFHFGKVGAARAEIEVHLKSCGECLAMYLEVKRDVEDGEGMKERPSPMVRRRILAQAKSRSAATRFSKRQLVVAGLAAAAAVLVVVMAWRAQMQRSQVSVPSVQMPAPEFLDSVDSGNVRPGHINVL